MREYNVKKAIKITGIGRDQLFYWVHFKGLISPKVLATGRGNRGTVFSLDNLIELSVIKSLADMLETSKIKELFEKGLMKYITEGFGKDKLVVIHKEQNEYNISLAKSKEELKKAINPAAILISPWGLYRKINYEKIDNLDKGFLWRDE